MEQNQEIDNVSQENAAQEVMAQPAQKMVSQDEMNRVVGRVKAEAADKARRQAEEQYQRELEALRQKQQEHNEAVPRDVDANAIYQQVQEKFNQEMQQRALEQQMTEVANNYQAKMLKGPEAYEDFEDVTKDFDPTAFPQLVFLMSGIDNAADVVYELAKNPQKLVTLDALSQRSPKLAQAELQRVALSISNNQQAQSEAANAQTDTPLDRLQPSRTTGSNGKPSIRDLRSQSWLKG